MSDLRTAAQQALEALETPIHEQSFMQKQNAITALEAALAEPVQEPVAYVDQRIHGWPDCFVMEANPPHTTPLYAAPPQRPAQPAGVVTSMVKGGVTWHIWPDQMPDGTTLYAAAPIIKPEIKEDKPFGYFRAEPFGWTDCAPTDEGAIPLYERPQAQQFFYNAWADEQIQKEKK